MSSLSRKRVKLRSALLAVAPRPLHCYYCQREMREDQTTLDHMTPLARGGANTLENSCLACSMCNHLKGPLTAEEFMHCRRRASLLDAMRKHWEMRISQQNLLKDPMWLEKHGVEAPVIRRQMHCLSYTLSEVWPKESVD
jgi:hypothetical protein